MTGRAAWGACFDRWAVPALMVFVAFNQLRMTHHAALSPWKGGGFGMFGSIDSPTARAIRCQAFDDAGEAIPLELSFDGPLNARLMHRLRCYPTPRHLLEVAATVVATDLLNTRVRAQRVSERLRLENPNADFDFAIAVADKDIYRLKSARDPDSSADHTRRAARAKTQMFRLRWDDSAARVYCEPLGGPVEFASGAAP